jgi:hypothetical protein
MTALAVLVAAAAAVLIDRAHGGGEDLGRRVRPQ